MSKMKMEISMNKAMLLKMKNSGRKINSSSRTSNNLNQMSLLLNNFRKMSLKDNNNNCKVVLKSNLKRLSMRSAMIMITKTLETVKMKREARSQSVAIFRRKSKFSKIEGVEF